MRRACKQRWITAGVLLVCLFVIFTITGCEALGLASVQGQDQSSAEGGKDTPEVSPPVQLTISAAGDVMAHSTQIKAQYDAATGTYDFNNNFQYVKKYLENADIAICNVETTFAGKEKGYSGYPAFNAPDDLAPALKTAGFDVAVTANNHCLDKGADGLRRTIEVLKQNGLAVAGTHAEGQPRYTMVDVKGVKAAIVAYTYETPQAGGRRTINAGYIPESILPALNSFGYETIEEDTAGIIRDIHEAREAGAEVIICFMHWGQEYHYTPANEDEILAKKLVDAGADVIFASHPHVIQPVEIVTSEDGREVPVFYSMGNFLSNQRLETVSNRKTEDGMIATVQLEILDGKVSLLKTSVLSTWVNKYDRGGKKVYEIIPITGDYKANPSVVDSRHQNSIEKSHDDSYEAVGVWWTEGE